MCVCLVTKQLVKVMARCHIAAMYNRSIVLARCHWSLAQNAHGSLSPHESATKTTSQSVDPILRGSSVCPTNIHTKHAMPIATGHIYVMHVVWPQMIITEQSSKLQANLKVKENRTQAGKNGSASSLTSYRSHLKPHCSVTIQYITRSASYYLKTSGAT